MIIKQFLVYEFFIQRLIFSLTENYLTIDFIPLKIKVNIILVSTATRLVKTNVRGCMDWFVIIWKMVLKFVKIAKIWTQKNCTEIF